MKISPPSVVPEKVTRKTDLLKYWCHQVNFLIGGECIPFNFEFPPLEIMVEVVRSDPETRILRGSKGARADEIDISKQFRALTLAEALVAPFQMSHFKLSNFYGRRGILSGFHEQVMVPWKHFLRELGFSWYRCFPILFFSGRDSATNYHMDLSQVLAWQVYGTKTFNGFRDPSRWAPTRNVVREKFREQMQRPSDIPEKELLSFVMEPGQFLWNQLLTPHWVGAGGELALSLNISHGGLRYRGRLCAHEEALEEWWRLHPAEIWRGPEDSEAVD